MLFIFIILVKTMTINGVNLRSLGLNQSNVVGTQSITSRGLPSILPSLHQSINSLQLGSPTETTLCGQHSEPLLEGPRWNNSVEYPVISERRVLPMVQTYSTPISPTDRSSAPSSAPSENSLYTKSILKTGYISPTMYPLASPFSAATPTMLPKTSLSDGLIHSSFASSSTGTDYPTSAPTEYKRSAARREVPSRSPGVSRRPSSSPSASRGTDYAVTNSPTRYRGFVARREVPSRSPAVSRRPSSSPSTTTRGADYAVITTNAPTKYRRSIMPRQISSPSPTSVVTGTNMPSSPDSPNNRTPISRGSVRATLAPSPSDYPPINQNSEKPTSATFNDDPGSLQNISMRYSSWLAIPSNSSEALTVAKFAVNATYGDSYISYEIVRIKSRIVSGIDYNLTVNTNTTNVTCVSNVFVVHSELQNISIVSNEKNPEGCSTAL